MTTDATDQSNAVARSFFSYMSALEIVLELDWDNWEIGLHPDDGDAADVARSKAQRFRFDPTVFAESYPDLLEEFRRFNPPERSGNLTPDAERLAVWRMVAERMDEAAASLRPGPSGVLWQKPHTDWFE